MDSIIVVIMLVSITQTCAKDLAVTRMGEPLDKLVDGLVDRAHKLLHLRSFDLEGTALGKPEHLGSPTIGSVKFPVPSSQLQIRRSPSLSGSLDRSQFLVPRSTSGHNPFTPSGVQVDPGSRRAALLGTVGAMLITQGATPALAKNRFEQINENIKKRKIANVEEGRSLESLRTTLEELQKAEQQADNGAYKEAYETLQYGPTKKLRQDLTDIEVALADTRPDFSDNEEPTLLKALEGFYNSLKVADVAKLEGRTIDTDSVKSTALKVQAACKDVITLLPSGSKKEEIATS